MMLYGLSIFDAMRLSKYYHYNSKDFIPNLCSRLYESLFSASLWGGYYVKLATTLSLL